jgi:hypothetical protein
VGCGGNGTPVGVPITIVLSPSSASINAGQSKNILATVSNDPSNKGVSWTLSGVGTLTNSTTTSVTYNAPASVASSSVAAVTATSVANSSVATSAQITVLPPGVANNVQPITVNGGVLANYANGVFTSVQICVPGTNTCQTIDNVLVDTGSAGLRLLASQITIPLQPLTDTSGNQLNDCINFLDGSFLWGLVEPADIIIAGETASATSIQAIANPIGYSFGAGCNTGQNEDTQQALGANGILGVGTEPFDCGTGCDPNNPSPQPVYYLCSASTQCVLTTVSCGSICGDTTPNQQVTNPVFNFAADNNGVILELSALPTGSDFAATVNGNMIFGIGTQSNNGLGTATVFTLDQFDSLTTVFSGQNLNSSFIDSGSNGLFFPNGIESGFPNNTIQTCAAPEQSFYCPIPAPTNFSVTNQGATQGNGTFNFSIDNYTNVFGQPDFALSELSGPLGTGACSNANPTACSFDWGLPFFYGRTVFTAIRGTTVGTTAGPFFAY